MTYLDQARDSADAEGENAVVPLRAQFGALRGQPEIQAGFSDAQVCWCLVFLNFLLTWEIVELFMSSDQSFSSIVKYHQSACCRAELAGRRRHRVGAALQHGRGAEARRGSRSAALVGGGRCARAQAQR